ncbi:Retrovirus-related pol polyprotein from transposon re1 [Thalictrum thalictroides]|uniref:Retrovirus-related pol polyprotein from transposon re1 n=1 Tax=Thalictrum thalictroides TaxID=46969 RepID=A0A7J6X2G7_THATH|nr:Retrovirus-related pol polyprotein from transposon re1 [Thalictrum thalictroides]
MWLRSILGELGFPQTDPSVLYCDNKSAIHLASDSILHEKTKHIEIDVHFLREKVRSGIVSPSFVGTKAQIADTLTKPVGPGDLQTIISKLGLLDIFAPA